MKKHLVVIGILAVSVLGSCKKDLNPNQGFGSDLAANQGGGSGTPEFANGEHMPNEILVKFKKGTSESGRANALARMGGRVQERILTKAMERFGDDDGVYLVRTSLNALEAVARAHGAEIEFAEPNWIYTHSYTANDIHYGTGKTWGLYSATSINGDPINSYGTHANTAWAKGHTGSTSIVIGIIDEGAMFDHEDLSGQIKNPGEFGGVSGKDDDGNGLIDDIYGWDFAANDNTTYDGTGDDHGTHVAGTIGAKGNNSLGVAGVNWNVTMISAKFLGSSGGTTANAIKAVDYFTDLKKRGLNVVATNNSWGGGGYSQALYDAIERSNAAGILFVAAAGNGNQAGRAIDIDSKPSYPASYNNSNIISVAAITKTGAIAKFSNYGATSVDIGAPGVEIASTVPGTTATGGYAYYDGTSMATPHVTGAVALYAAYHTGASASAIKAAILNSAVATSSLRGKCVTGGRLNVSGF